jgi:succinyl-diaminopimelate desuccinylase
MSASESPAASDVLALSCELIRRASVTPDDAGCQQLIATRLSASGFRCATLDVGNVRNLWATHGTEGPVLVFLGHTDVVPTGPVGAWSSDPFVPVIRDGHLFGRGAADMKGSVAAFVCALEGFVATQPDHAGTVALLLTSDEEGDAIDGVRAVAEHFRKTGQRIDWCVVGEPSSAKRLGDTVRIGRRGSLSGKLRVRGVLGHVAYPDRADNPIHRFAPALVELTTRRWDEGSEEFPPTSFQVSNIAAGTGANNVIPGELLADFNFRYSTQWSAEQLRAEVEATLARHRIDFGIDWHLSGAPFLTRSGTLRSVVRETLRLHCGTTPEENTAGGTSDGRFIAPLGAEVVELGPINASIHKVDECVALRDLDALVLIYRDIATRLLRRA